jgi:hypothetical protein
MFYILALHALALVGATTSDPSAQDAVQGFLFSYSSTNLNLPILPSCPGTLTIPPLGSFFIGSGGSSTALHVHDART